MRITTSFGPLTWTRVTEPSRLTPFPSTRRFMTGPEMTVQICGLWSAGFTLYMVTIIEIYSVKPACEVARSPSSTLTAVLYHGRNRGSKEALHHSMPGHCA
jgi:hypothetical protein